MTITLNGSEGITLDNGAADGAQVSLSSSGYSNWNLDNYSGRLRAYYGSTEYFTVNSSGNVGIGTSSPANKLDVQGSGNVYGRVYSTSTNNAGLRLGNSATDWYLIGAGQTLQFYDGIAAAERARIDSSGNFYVGSDTTCNLTDFRSKSNAANGYQKLAGGLIIQWGYNSSSSAGATITFPIAFPNACRCVVATPNNAAGYDTENIQVRSVSTSTFVLQMQNKTTPAYWVAYGY